VDRRRFLLTTLAGAVSAPLAAEAQSTVPGVVVIYSRTRTPTSLLGKNAAATGPVTARRSV